MELPDPAPSAAPFREATELSEAASISAIGRKSPDIVPDSEEEFEPTQPAHPEQTRNETMEEREVEKLIRDCSIHDPVPSEPPGDVGMDIDLSMLPHYSRYWASPVFGPDPYPPDNRDSSDANPRWSEHFGVDVRATAESKTSDTAVMIDQSTPAKPEQRTASPVPSNPDVPGDGEVVVEEPPALAPNDPNALVYVSTVSLSLDLDLMRYPASPRIFIFDSLGSRHIQAVNVLTGYLQMEAKDKKGLDETTRAVGKEAMVCHSIYAYLLDVHNQSLHTGSIPTELLRLRRLRLAFCETIHGRPDSAYRDDSRRS